MSSNSSVKFCTNCEKFVPTEQWVSHGKGKTANLSCRKPRRSRVLSFADLSGDFRQYPLRAHFYVDKVRSSLTAMTNGCNSQHIYSLFQNPAILEQMDIIYNCHQQLIQLAPGLFTNTQPLVTPLVTQPLVPQPVYKCVLVGKDFVGKTSFVNKLSNGIFVKKYSATLGVEVSPVVVQANGRSVAFDIWDVEGRADSRGLKDGYFIGAHCAIIMFDMTSIQSYKNLDDWHQSLVRIHKEMPIVIVGNKSDLKYKKLKDNSIKFHRTHNLQYYQISVKSGENITKPLDYLAKIFVQN